MSPKPLSPIGILKSPRRFYGYDEIWTYASGIDYTDYMNPKPIGWRGNQTMKSVKEVLNEISVLKTVDDCPSVEHSYVWYEPNKTDPVDYKLLNFELTRGLFPSPICCKAVNPNGYKNAINGIEIAFNASNKAYKSMKVIISDTISSSVFKQHDQNLIGDKLRTPKEENGYFHYKVKLSKEVNLENDPNYPCIDYNIVGQYHLCLQNEFIKENMKISNCTPPWMTDDETLWCQGGPKLKSQYEISKWTSFIVDVNVGRAQHGICSVPCKSTKYYANEFGFKEDKEMKGIIIIFDNLVEKTISELQIGPRTLVTRFGGIIGVGKNLMWVIIFAISGLGFCSSKAKRDKDNIEAQTDSSQEKSHV